MPKVSVNICCYNGEKFVKEAMESVLRQTYGDFEIIFLNDGSTDRTEEVVKSFDDPRVRYFYQKNTGLGAARNKALGFSRGDYIAFLDCDDTWEPEKLELQVKMLNDNPDIGLVHSDGYNVDENGRIINRLFQKRYPERGDVVEDLIKDYRLACSAAVIRKELLDKCGLFRDDFKISEEYDLFLRMSLVTKFDYIDKTLVKIKRHSENISWDIERFFREGVISLDCLIKKIDDDNLKKHIKDKLALFHAELAKVYLLKELRQEARVESRLALWHHGYRPRALLLHLFSYLPGGIYNRLIRTLEKRWNRI